MTFAEWVFGARRVWEDSIMRWTTVVTVVLVASMTTYALLKLIPVGLQSGVLTLHYNIYLGIDDVGAWWWILLSPVSMWLWLILNTALACGLQREHELAAKACILLTSIIAILWSVSIWFLVLVNI